MRKYSVLIKLISHHVPEMNEWMGGKEWIERLMDEWIGMDRGMDG